MKVDKDFTDTSEESREDTKGFKPYKIIMPLICLALSAVIVYFTVGIYKKTDSGSGFSKSYSAKSSKTESENAEKDEEPKESEGGNPISSTAVSDNISSEPTVVDSQSSISVTPSQTTASKSSTKASNTAVVNINTAGKEELMTLYGIGDAKAQRIIDYRNSYGSFQNIEQITEVSGIGEKTFLKNKERLTVG